MIKSEQGIIHNFQDPCALSIVCLLTFMGTVVAQCWVHGGEA